MKRKKHFKELSLDAEDKNKWNIKEIHYRDIYGSLLWSTPNIFRKLYKVDDVIVHEGIGYCIKRVAVEDNIEHVNIVCIKRCSSLKREFYAMKNRAR